MERPTASDPERHWPTIVSRRLTASLSLLSPAPLSIYSAAAQQMQEDEAAAKAAAEEAAAKLAAARERIAELEGLVAELEKGFEEVRVVVVAEEREREGKECS